MRRFGIGLLLLVLCLAETLLVQGQPSKVHLGWSQNDVYKTMTVVWHSQSLDTQRVVYDVKSQSAAAGYAWAKHGTGASVQPTTGTDGSTITTTAMPGYYYRAELTGLEPGTTYYFRVVDDEDRATDEWSFRTIEPNEEIQFAFAGDSQRPFETAEGEAGQLLSRPTAPANWPYMRDFLTQLAASEDPDFILVLGDFVARGNNPDQWENWLDAWQENAVTSSGRMIPIVPVVGNHDLGDYPDVDSSYEWILGLFACPQPISGRPWYSLDFPELHMTVLAATSQSTASSWAGAVAEAEAQRQWLREDLLTAPEARWKLVAFHFNYLGCYASVHEVSKRCLYRDVDRDPAGLRRRRGSDGPYAQLHANLAGHPGCRCALRPSWALLQPGAQLGRRYYVHRSGHVGGTREPDFEGDRL